MFDCNEDGNSVTWQYIQEVILQYCSTEIKARPSRWISAQASLMRKPRTHVYPGRKSNGNARVGLRKHPNFEPNIRLLESCGSGGAFRVASRARVAVLRREDSTVERSPDHVASKAFWTMRQSSTDAAARCPVITILQLSKGVRHWARWKHPGRTFI